MPTPSAMSSDSTEPFEDDWLLNNGFPVSVAFESPVLVAWAGDVEGLDVGSPGMPVELLSVRGKDVEIEVEVGFNDEGLCDAADGICGGSDDES